MLRPFPPMISNDREWAWRLASHPPHTEEAGHLTRTSADRMQQGAFARREVPLPVAGFGLSLDEYFEAASHAASQSTPLEGQPGQDLAVVAHVVYYNRSELLRLRGDP